MGVRVPLPVLVLFFRADVAANRDAEDAAEPIDAARTPPAGTSRFAIRPLGADLRTGADVTGRGDLAATAQGARRR